MQRTAETPEDAKSTLEALIDFSLAHGGTQCFHGWPRAIVADYLIFHLLQGTIVYCRDEAGEIIGLAIGWKCREKMLRAPGFVYRPFAWQKEHAQGDAFYFAETICRQPCLDRLMAEFAYRVPEWRRLKLFAIRGGKLRSFGDPEQFVALVARKGKSL